MLPCAARCQGEYGFDDVFLGVPCKLGAGGIEDIVEIELDEEEQGALSRSAAAVKRVADVVRGL